MKLKSGMNPILMLIVAILIRRDGGTAFYKQKRLTKNGREFYLLGHCEYDYDTLAKEYYRDVEKGIKPDIPYNYFPDNNVTRKPVMTWRSHASLIYQNWLNYYLYQQTPYDLEDLKKMYENE